MVKPGDEWADVSGDTPPDRDLWRGVNPSALAGVQAEDLITNVLGGHIDHAQQQPPRPERQRPPPWPDKELTCQALALFATGGAIRESTAPKGMIAPSATSELLEVLARIGGTYRLKLQCHHDFCQQRLGWWKLDTANGIALVDDRPNRASDRTSEPRPFTGAARDGKGYRGGPNSDDADGTYAVTCAGCQRRIDLGVEYRTRLFIQALHDHQNVVLV